MSTPYGFEWGPIEVTRLAEINGRVVLEVKTAHHSLQIAASPKGHTLRVWKDHEEIT